MSLNDWLVLLVAVLVLLGFGAVLGFAYGRVYVEEQEREEAGQ